MNQPYQHTTPTTNEERNVGSERLRIGLTALQRQLEASAPDSRGYFDAYSSTLREVLDEEGLHGSTEECRNRRSKVVAQLNRLAREELGISFNDLCKPAEHVSLEAALNAEPVLARPVLRDTEVTLPVELGTVWGLERSPFVGIVVCKKANQIYDALGAAEERLRQAQAEVSRLALPSRRWMLVEEGATYELAPAGYAPHTETRGVLIRSKLENLTGNQMIETYLENIAVSTSLYTSRAITALVVCFEAAHPIRTNAERKWLQDLRWRLQQQLQLQPHNTPVQLFEVLTWPVPSMPAPAEGGLFQWIEKGATEQMSAMQSPTCPALARWVDEATKQGRIQRDRNESRAPYSQLIDLFLKHPELAGKLDQFPPATEVVADLDNLISNRTDFLHPPLVQAAADAVLDEQLLRLVADHLPEHLRDLIAAYAQSCRPIAQFAALFAARDDPRLLDVWLDAFLEACTDAQSFPSKKDLFADSRRGPFVADLVVALIRRVRRTDPTRTDPARTYLAELKSVLSPRARELMQLANHQENEIYAQVLDGSADMLPELVYDLLRIDPKAAMATVLPDTMHLATPARWWLLAAQQLQPAMLNKLLGRNAAERAVFGLCHPEELDQLRSDRLAWDRIDRCRLHRSYKQPEIDDALICW
jgi:hypothetical protein